MAEHAATPSTHQFDLACAADVLSILFFDDGWLAVRFFTFWLVADD